MGELEAKFVQNLNNGFGGNGDASMKAYGSLNCPSMIGPTVTQTAPNTSNNKNANNSGSNSIRFQSPYAMTNINNNGKSDGGDEIVGSGVGGLGCDVLVSGNIEDRFQLNHHLSSPRKTANNDFGAKEKRIFVFDSCEHNETSIDKHTDHTFDRRLND
ncbi:hypothetical protein QR98_0075870 [Sarcoptes scabiei]|uniref:Uncharacterized protein n=1 Tax=Sarcoptes scabiei TaxID=52283 RepID=A0A132ADQ8_SARSC|nr:hypothetical protein QR98_0075870 [Sarcoptes scabiei]